MIAARVDRASARAGWANRVSDKLDENRMLVTEKVFGFLIAAIAVQLVLDAWSQSESSRRLRTRATAYARSHAGREGRLRRLRGAVRR